MEQGGQRWSREEWGLVTEGAAQCSDEKDLKAGTLPQVRSLCLRLDCQLARQWPLLSPSSEGKMVHRYPG